MRKQMDDLYKTQSEINERLPFNEFMTANQRAQDILVGSFFGIPLGSYVESMSFSF